MAGKDERDERDARVAAAVRKGDMELALDAVRPIAVTVAKKFEAQLGGMDYTMAVCRLKAATALLKWDPGRGPVGPFLGVSMERACMSELRVGAKAREREVQGLESSLDVPDPSPASSVAAEWTAMVDADPTRTKIPGLEDVLAMPASESESERIAKAAAAFVSAVAPVYVRSRPECRGVAWLDESLRLVFV